MGRFVVAAIIMVCYSASANASPITIDFSGASLGTPTTYGEDGFRFTALDTGASGLNHFDITSGTFGRQMALHGGSNAEDVEITREGGGQFDFQSLFFESVTNDWQLLSSAGGTHTFTVPGTLDLTGVAGWQNLDWVRIRTVVLPAPSSASLFIDNVVLNNDPGSTTPVPEPATFVLVLAGGGLAIARRRRS